jgi:hypothetical protein
MNCTGIRPGKIYEMTDGGDENWSIMLERILIPNRAELKT